MQKNTVELMDELEQDLTVEAPKMKELKEYEKLLLVEANRETHCRALKLVKYGCFNQVQEAKVDFSKYERIDNGKKLYGKYQLYRNLETMQLTYILPLVENNKGSEDERNDLKPYAYDCIYIEQMDNEAFLLVEKAAKKNLTSAVKVAYISALTAYIVAFLYTLITFFITFFNNISDGFSTALVAVSVNSISLSCVLSSAPLMVLMVIKYKNYKEN